MALQGKFVVDNSPVETLVMYGAGVYAAYSGNGIYKNRGGCTGIPDNGPIPAGKYWLVDRPKGGIGSQMQAQLKDAWNGLVGHPSNHSEWFALYRDDGVIDDWTWINGVKRGNFRLHPVGGQNISLGCITLTSVTGFRELRQKLLSNPTVPAGHSGLQAYGWIEVTTIGTTCP
jgi:hypothetical protein